MLTRFLQTVLLGALLFVAPLALALLLLPAGDHEELQLRRAGFADLEGWSQDDHAAALATFRNSCAVLMAKEPAVPVKPQRIGGNVEDWRRVCTRARDEAAAAAPRGFFEEHFTPLAVLSRGEPEGLFTGYYEPVFDGSLEPGPDYPVPAYGRPPELVTVDLGLFRADLGGRRIAGRVSDGRLQPFESRADIVTGALAGRGLELLWLKKEVDLFFLQIQGSGRVRLPDGRLIGIGYSGPNGHPYTAIGRFLVERGEVAREDMSMQAIRRWIESHPDEGRALMAENASYVFFRFLENGGPEGSLGSVLTPGRSLAVDRRLLPLGAPVWLQTSHPDPAAPDDELSDKPLNRLMVAEDTGGAIDGGVRGDVFWGHGPEAEIIAGHMANPGRYFLLLPTELAERVLAGDARRGERQ